jgi:hypothetical protein
MVGLKVYKDNGELKKGNSKLTIALYNEAVNLCKENLKQTTKILDRYANVFVVQECSEE